MSLPSSDLSAATQAIQDHQRILVLPHANVDPDALSGALAMYQLLRELGKDVTVVCPDTPPETLKFLPGFEKVENEVKESQNFVITINLGEGMEVDKLRYAVEDHRVNIIVVPKSGKIRPEQISLGGDEHRYDLIVVVDTADLSLLGSVYTDHVDLFSEVPVLNIDHHVSNSRYGQLQLIDTTSASVTEVLYHWMTSVPSYRRLLTADIATLLLTGLITDTRSFQNPNTTPRALEVAAELLDLGARQQEIIRNVYKTKPLSTLKIWGRALNRIQVDPAAGIAWSAVSREDLSEMEATSKETQGILDELITTIPDADVHVLFTELEEGGLKASLRSSPSVDVNKIAARTFGGGGHPRAAGFRVAHFSNFQLQVLECIQRLKEEMRRDHSEDTARPVPPPRESSPSNVVSSPATNERLPEAKGQRQSKDVLESLDAQKATNREQDILEDISGV